MIHIGDYNTLPVLTNSVRGVRLGTEAEHVFLPASQVPEGTAVGDTLEVFVYDSGSDGPQATRHRPYATVGEFAYLEVVDVNQVGAFVDWGLPKDLFVPYGRQYAPVRKGDWVVVGVTRDRHTNRVMGTTTLSGCFDDQVEHYEPGTEVELLVYGFNDLGAQVVVDGRHAGLVFRDQIHQPLYVGDSPKGYIARVRIDHRLDVVLQRPGKAGRDEAQRAVLEALEAHGGFLALNDKSPPAEIREVLNMSKKTFKRAIGGLYKAHTVDLVDGGVRKLED